jgi:hypothetical protein
MAREAMATPTLDEIREHLIEVAQAGETVTYTDL